MCCLNVLALLESILTIYLINPQGPESPQKVSGLPGH